jgi:signal peptidase I
MSLRRRISTSIVEYRSLLVFVVSMLLFRSAFADWTYVPSGSMNPTIVEGDRVLVDKMAYGLRVPFTTTLLTHGSDPKRGDIVIFASPKDGITLIKRVIGLPGDRIEMRDEQLLVNGISTNYSVARDVADADLPRATRAQDHDYLTEHLADRPHAIMVLPQRMAMRSFGPMLVPPGDYLMLGDSRDNSEDSRYIGFVPRASIVGRAFRVAYSLNADRWYLPRADRVMTPLR